MKVLGTKRPNERFLWSVGADAMVYSIKVFNSSPCRSMTIIPGESAVTNTAWNTRRTYFPNVDNRLGAHSLYGFDAKKTNTGRIATRTLFKSERPVISLVMTMKGLPKWKPPKLRINLSRVEANSCFDQENSTDQSKDWVAKVGIAYSHYGPLSVTFESTMSVNKIKSCTPKTEHRTQNHKDWKRKCQPLTSVV